MTEKLIKTPGSEKHTLHNDALVTIGRIIKAYGLRGEIKAESLSNISGRFKSLSDITLELKSGECVQLEVEYTRMSGDIVILKLSGIDDREAAEKLNGAYISVTLDKVAPLNEYSYYIFDLEGMDVFDVNNTKIGSVIKVEQYPANDVIIVAKETEEVMIPAIKEFIVGVDIKEKKITVNLPDGLPTYPRT